MGPVLLWIQIHNGYMLKGSFNTHQEAAESMAKVYQDCSVAFKPNFKIEEPISTGTPLADLEAKK